MWQTGVLKSVMCPHTFQGEAPFLLWIASLDARHRGKLHETIGCAALTSAALTSRAACALACDLSQGDWAERCG
jgi:hypothetical protein